MLQVLQSLQSGRVTSEQVPAPSAAAGQVLIATRRSLVSAGTERMLLEFGRKGWLDKARSQPERVRQVLDKAKTDGVLQTLEAVRAKLEQPLALGYSSAGVVVAVGAGVSDLAVGDRVACNGKHAELSSVPRHLCARVPDVVSDDAAAFTVLGAIALQGVRLAAPTLGECVVVTGLGLIGLLTVQVLRAHGCRVLGCDLDAGRLALAARLGAEVVDASQQDVLAVASAFSRGRGVDAVLVTASTDSDGPVAQAARMSRKRGRIVLVGQAGLALERADFFEKELTFQVSCSYGPGRYDPEYEQGGHDYPLGFVRWTEQRNFEAVLDLMAAGALDVSPLISHRFEVEQAPAAYDLLAGEQPSLGILLEYPERSQPHGASGALGASAPKHARQIALSERPIAPGRARVAFVGTGNYAGRTLIPAFKAAGASLHTAISQGGVSALHYGRKFGFGHASTDVEAVLGDATVDAVVIATRHASHAQLTLRALRAGKHVFVEKPLCLQLAELAEIEAELTRRPEQRLTVGFNRRFAPHVVAMRRLVATLGAPKAIGMTVNAGALPAGHWLLDPRVGGGRIVGEACHFIDLLRHLAGCPIVEQSVRRLGSAHGPAGAQDVVLTLSFSDGSLGTITYLSNGNKGFPKERLELFCAGRVLQLDNFRRLRGWGFDGFSHKLALEQDKGQSACAQAFVDALRGGGPGPIPLGELLEVSRASILAQEAAER
jgi:predicted dehydrogenase/threonine dehydrogenase-like Zn-dependent dehydrogenase